MLRKLLITLVFVVILNPCDSRGQTKFKSLDKKILPGWKSTEETIRDDSNPLKPIAQKSKTNYFQFPTNVSSTFYKDSLVLKAFKEEIDKYIKPDYFPPFFVDKATLYDPDYPEDPTGYYIAYYRNGSLIVISGDSTQYHYIIQSGFDDAQDLISKARTFFNIPDIESSLFHQDKWWGLKSDFQHHGKKYEIRGYERTYKLYTTLDELESIPSQTIPVIELVVYNE
ncbi:MAG: hypothetical protein GY855_17735 [candidate division Zixibacteria bacterium]|nr:hypothetical protein [candidate division Zixibacteria bacterium]